jgi:hypothetical protein
VTRAHARSVSGMLARRGRLPRDAGLEQLPTAAQTSATGVWAYTRGRESASSVFSHISMLRGELAD